MLHQCRCDRPVEVRLSTLIGFEGIEDTERLRIETNGEPCSCQRLRYGKRSRTRQEGGDFGLLAGFRLELHKQCDSSLNCHLHLHNKCAFRASDRRPPQRVSVLPIRRPISGQDYYALAGKNCSAGQRQSLAPSNGGQCTALTNRAPEMVRCLPATLRVLDLCPCSRKYLNLPHSPS